MAKLHSLQKNWAKFYFVFIAMLLLNHNAVNGFNFNELATIFSEYPCPSGSVLRQEFAAASSDSSTVIIRVVCFDANGDVTLTIKDTIPNPHKEAIGYKKEEELAGPNKGKKTISIKM